VKPGRKKEGKVGREEGSKEEMQDERGRVEMERDKKEEIKDAWRK
jgi:hypothetical protein